MPLLFARPSIAPVARTLADTNGGLGGGVAYPTPSSGTITQLGSGMSLASTSTPMNGASRCATGDRSTTRPVLQIWSGGDYFRRASALREWGAHRQLRRRCCNDARAGRLPRQDPELAKSLHLTVIH